MYTCMCIRFFTQDSVTDPLVYLEVQATCDQPEAVQCEQYHISVVPTKTPMFPLWRTDLSGLTWTRKSFEARLGGNILCIMVTPSNEGEDGTDSSCMSQIPSTWRCRPLPVVYRLSFHHLLIAPSPVTFNLNNHRCVNSASNALFCYRCCGLVSTNA